MLAARSLHARARLRALLLELGRAGCSGEVATLEVHVCVHVHVYAHETSEKRAYAAVQRSVVHRTWECRPCEYSEVVHLKSLDYARLRLITLSSTHNVRELTQKDSRVIKP